MDNAQPGRHPEAPPMLNPQPRRHPEAPRMLNPQPRRHPEAPRFYQRGEGSRADRLRPMARCQMLPTRLLARLKTAGGDTLDARNR